MGAYLAWLGVLAAGCGEEDAPRDEPTTAASVSFVGDSWALPVDDLRRVAQEAGVEASEARHGPRGGPLARRAAELLRVLALRTGDREPFEQARRHLEAEARGSQVECDLLLELARLLARDLRDLRAAHDVADEATRRYQEDASASTCAAELARMAAVLAPLQRESAGGARAEARLVGLHVHGAGRAAAAVRVALYLDRAVVFSRDELPAEKNFPRRLFIDLPGVKVAEDVPESVEVGEAGLLRVRRGVPRPGVTRVVLDLKPTSDYRFFFLTDPHRLFIDVAAESTDPGPGERPLVVLDPGHGGDDYGARYQGLTEAELVLDLARRAAAVLMSRHPSIRVVLTRNDDRFVSLDERVAMANAWGADVFVSLHLNAADVEVDRGGVTTFVLDTSNDRQALRLAARENGTTAAEVTELQRLLAGFRRKDQAVASGRLAEILQASVLSAGRRHLPNLANRGVRSAMFYVLVGARMPAVLLEASFMTFPEDARALRTEGYRQSLAEGVAEGLAAYVAK